MSTANVPHLSAQEVKQHEEAGILPPTVNVGDVERWVSAIGGTALIVQGLRSRSFPGAALALLGSGLVYRGLSGHCGAYQAMKINTASTKQHGEHVHRGRLIKHATVVDRPAQELYEFWADVENAPRFMANVQKVMKTGPKTSHWVSDGPLGKTFEWDSEEINMVPGHLISWRSLPGSDVTQAGAVRFEPNTGGRGTKVTLEVNYEPPAGALGVAMAKLIGQDPDAQSKENLRRFKQLMEAGEVTTTEGQSSGRG